MKKLLIVILVIAGFSTAAQSVDTTKTQVSAITANPDSVYSKVDLQAHFPGGEQLWNQYLMKSIEKNIDKLFKDNASNGTCEVQFIIDIDGSISNAEALTLKNPLLSKIFTDVIKKGPKWIPAQMNG